MMVLFFSCTSYAQESGLRVEIKNELASVQPNTSFEVTTKITNTGLQDQSLQVWPCSYSDNWTTDSPFVYLDQQECDKNGILNVLLKSHEVYERKLSLKITNLPAREIMVNEITFILGFMQANLKGEKMNRRLGAIPSPLKLKINTRKNKNETFSRRTLV